MKNNPGALASLKINIFIIIVLHRVQTRMEYRGEKFKTIDLHDKSDILSTHIRKCLMPNAFTGIGFLFVENLMARDLLTI